MVHGGFLLASTSLYRVIELKSMDIKCRFLNLLSIVLGRSLSGTYDQE